MRPLLEELLGRTQEEGDCLVWTGVHAQGVPQYFVLRDETPQGKSKRGHYVSARRLIWELSGRGEVLADLRPVMKCRHPSCVLMAHMRLMTIKQIARLAAKEGRFSTPQRKAAISAGRRKAKGTKLTMEQAREIRASTDTQAALAERYGIHKSRVWRIKQGTGWAEAANGASVFTWRPAA